MTRFLRGRLWFVSITLLMAAVFGLANALAQSLLAPARIDFTARGLYSLSPGTLETLRNIAEPIDVTFVYSRGVGQDFPIIRTHATRVRELLASYETLSRGQLRVRELDPIPFSEAEDVALAAGLAPLSTEGTDPLYLGLYMQNSVDDQSVIPFLAPERETVLEYELTRMIARLDDPSLATVGVLSGIRGMEGRGVETGYAVLRDLAESHRLEPIETDFVSLPDDLDLLILAHPPDLDPFQYWLIDQFLMRKGRLLVFLDPAARMTQGGGLFDPEARQPASGLGRLGRHWGLDLSDDVVADVASALPVQSEDADGRVNVTGQPLFIAAPLEGIDRNDPITSDLRRSVNMGAPGALSYSGEGLEFDPLITTSPAPSYYDAATALGVIDPQDVILAYTPLDEPLTLAARLSGAFTTAFPDGAPPVMQTGDEVRDALAVAAAAEMPPHVAASKGTGVVVVVADADLLDDGFFLNPGTGAALADNGAFVLNAVDALLGNDDLLSLRSRADSLRPMTRVEDLRSRAEAQFFAEQSALEQRLAAAQSRLRDYQRNAEAAGFVAADFEAELSPEERADVQNLRSDIVETRARLRAIERDFREEIDRLENTLKALNIWLPPLVVFLIGTVVYIRRRSGG